MSMPPQERELEKQLQEPQDQDRDRDQDQSPSSATDGSSSRFFCEELEEDLGAAIESSNAQAQAPASDLIATIAQNVVGRHELFDSPFGDKALVYADFTASGKSLRCIEDYMQREVMPLYGNTHTTTSITGLQTTCFRHEARQIIAQAVNAKITGRGAEDSVLFTGQGSTSAVAQLVTALGLHVPLTTSDPSQRPVVFVGPFEHHSNLLPWRESVAEVVVIPENDRGQVDVDVLQEKLRQYAARPLKMGAFSAASNLTGVLSDVDTITAVLHMHGALAFWDYATCAPYVAIDMNPVVVGERRPFVYKDAVFISGHKFIGGPGSPGVLVVKKRLLGNAVPTTPGGGTVFFVTERDHRYLSNREEREEGGTPDILGSIRLGLAFELKQRVGTQQIMELEKRHVQRVRASLATSDKIVLLGRDDVEQLPVFSFLIRCGDRFLHYNFVCALLNDLFGIQTRGGCQCAGPYASRLLGLAKQDVLAFERALIEKKEMLRPGFSRISFPYFMEDDELDYILEAIHFVAEHGWRFLPQYKFNHKSGAWKHTSRFTRFPNRKWLSHFTFSEPTSTPRQVTDIQQHRRENLEMAQQLLRDTAKHAPAVAASVAQMLDDAYESLRWFVYPSEAAQVLKRGEDSIPLSTAVVGPYQPSRYLTGELHHQWEEPQQTESQPSSPVANGAATQCQLGTCCPPVPSAVENGRQVGGKYPLRSAAGASAAAAAAPVCTVVAPASSAAPMVCDATVALTKAQEVTSQMAEKLATTKLFPTPPKKLMRWVGQALMQWNMIQDGDRLLLGVSGGKDSLSLLHILLNVQKRAPVRFYLACATVDPQTPSFDPSPLKEYMKTLGVEYFYLSENIIERAACEMQGDSICSYCSRMKRGLLYTCCRQKGFNKLVLAQHLDDLAESFFMSAIHNGQLRTMKAKYWNDERDVEILRPLAYVREHELKRFAYDSRLPVINENCPACFEEPKERHRVKKMLAQEESLFPDMYNSIRRALLPLMDDEIYAPLNAIRQRIETSKQTRSKAASAKAQAKSKKTPQPEVQQKQEENGVSEEKS
ncbi:hypothetical protein PINS_up021314 [Pythium insidiosum]|nr:hypothetical protein PINS_up021314 [Pythium insidiosum]